METNLTSGGIRRRRIAAGITQAQLARAAGCSLAMIRLLESGYAPARSAVVPRIDAVLAGRQPGPESMSGPAADAARALAWSDDPDGPIAVATVPQGPDAIVIRGLREIQAGLEAELQYRSGLRAALMRGDDLGRPDQAFVVIAWSGGPAPGVLDGVPHVLLAGGDES